MFKRNIIVVSMLLAFAFMGSTASAAYVAVPGDLLRTADDATVVVVMDNNSRVPVSADAFLVRYNNNFGLVKTVTLAERGNYNSDLQTINSMSSLASGTVFIYEVDQPGIFLIDNGFKRLFSTYTGFENAGYSLKNVQWAGTYTSYPTGTSIQ
jgi:hypothetical protein